MNGGTAGRLHVTVSFGTGVGRMVDRQKIETILRRRFPGSDRGQVAAAANAIMGLDDEWEEVQRPDPGRSTEELARGSRLLVFRRTDHDEHA